MRYGRDPLSLDSAGTPIGLTTTQCGRNEQGIPADVQAYCDAYGETLLDGWGKRRSEWQMSLGIQHELLPRFSAEFTYNRRNYSNLTVSDQLGIGCDRFNGAQELSACQDGYLNFSSPNYGFFSVTAPSHPDLPGGGGYVIRGLANPNATLPVGTAVRRDDHGGPGLHVELLRHELRLARNQSVAPGRLARQRRDDHGPRGARPVLVDARRSGCSAARWRDAVLQPLHAVGNERPRHCQLHDSQGRRADGHCVPVADGPAAKRHTPV